MSDTPQITQSIVSPDVTNDRSLSVQTGNKIVVLVPWEEWKQCLVRGVRTFIQMFIFLVGGGTVYQFLTSLGIPPASAANLPSTGHPLADAVCYALVFAIVVVLWNFVEFWLDIDIHAPKWRS